MIQTVFHTLGRNVRNIEIVTVKMNEIFVIRSKIKETVDDFCFFGILIGKELNRLKNAVFKVNTAYEIKIRSTGRKACGFDVNKKALLTGRQLFKGVIQINIVYYISNFLVFEITRDNYLGKSMIWYHRMKAEGDLFFLLINPLTLSFNIAVLIIDYLFRRKVNHT